MLIGDDGCNDEIDNPTQPKEEWNIYIWASETLRGYSKGDILAIGRNVEEARQNVISTKEFKERLHKDDFKSIKKEIEAEPYLITKATFFYGSEYSIYTYIDPRLS